VRNLVPGIDADLRRRLRLRHLPGIRRSRLVAALPPKTDMEETMLTLRRRRTQRLPASYA